MNAHDVLVLHLVASDISAEARDALRLILEHPDPGIAQRVIPVGKGGGRPHATPHAITPNAPPLLHWILGLALRRKLERCTSLTPRRPAVIHAWSPGAAQAFLPLAATHRPMVLNAEPGMRPHLLAAWSRSGTLGFVCQSRAVQRQLFSAGVPEARCVLIRPAVADSAPIGPDRRADVRRQLKLDERHVVITALPLTSCPTATFTATWAALLLEKVRPEVRLMIPASSPGAERARRLAVSCRHERVIRSLPPTMPWRDSLGASDLAVYLPSGDAPIASLANALASGCPVVASSVPTVTELLVDGETAWLCAPDDPKDAARRMLQAIENVQQSRRQADQARDLARRTFFTPLMLAAYRRLYLNLATRRPAASAQLHALLST